MGLTDRLRDLDQRLLPGTREPDEDAESYLRRVATGRAITPAQAGDVLTALREHLGIANEEPAEEGSENEAKDDQANDDKAKDESPGNEKDEAEESEESEEDESDGKSDDES